MMSNVQRLARVHGLGGGGGGEVGVGVGVELDNCGTVMRLLLGRGAEVAVTTTVVLSRNSVVVKGSAGCASKKLVTFPLGQASSLHGPVLQTPSEFSPWHKPARQNFAHFSASEPSCLQNCFIQLAKYWSHLTQGSLSPKSSSSDSGAREQVGPSVREG